MEQKKNPYANLVVRVGKGGRPPESIEKRFTEKVAPPNEQGCSLWVGATNANGSLKTLRGKISYEGTATNAHKVMWILAYGSPPTRNIHPFRCKNYLCMTPDHWRETIVSIPMRSAEEIQDAAEKKRVQDLGRKERKAEKRKKRLEALAKRKARGQGKEEFTPAFYEEMRRRGMGKA